MGYAAMSVYAHLGSSAVSSSADDARGAASAIMETATCSQSLFGGKSRLIEQLQTMKRECAEGNWDGNGARGIDPAAVVKAEVLVRNLPDEFPLPECAPEPDGAVSLDWIHSRYRLLSLSVGSSNRLAFAWLDGTDKGHGVVQFDGASLPPRILNEILTIVKHGTTALRVA